MLGLEGCRRAGKAQSAATFFWKILKIFSLRTLAPLRLSGEIPKTEFSICHAFIRQHVDHALTDHSFRMPRFRSLFASLSFLNFSFSGSHTRGRFNA
jgi:hypothetical protein